MDNLIDLLNTTIVIPVRIDHNDRLINIQINLKYLLKHFKTNIIIMENDKISHYHDFDIPNNHSCNIKHVFEQTDNIEFHKTKIINNSLNYISTQVFAFCDVDCFLPINTYIEAQNYILNNNYVMCQPYNNMIIYNIPFENKDKILTHSIEHIYDLSIPSDNTKICTGGIIFYNIDIFKKIGKMNEKFISYAFEDDEIFYRFIRLQYKIKYLNYNLYHMNHYIGNFSTKNINYGKNLMLYNTISKMTLNELKEYYNIPYIKHLYTTNLQIKIENISNHILKKISIVIIDMIDILENIKQQNDIDIIYINHNIQYNNNEIIKKIIDNAYKCSIIYTNDTNILNKNINIITYNKNIKIYCI